jgi:8-oxo-dGTP pyrophosphatase MutT (NUDIX family)
VKRYRLDLRPCYGQQMRLLILIRPAMKAADRIRRAYWRFRGRTIYGVMVMAFTPDGQLVLVRQTYSPGWSLPGGGRRADEEPTAAALRELREEIGLTRWTDVDILVSLDRPLSGAPASIDLIRVNDAEFTFRPNFEIESVATFDVNNLPSNLSKWSTYFIEAAAIYVQRKA